MYKRRVIVIAAICLCCALLIYAGIYFIPTDSTSLNKTLQATKLDSDGNVVSSAQIPLQGSYKKYLLKEDVFNLFISPFVNLKNFNFIASGETSVALRTIRDDFYVIDGTAWDTSRGDTVFVTVRMSLDFEYWLIYVHDNDQPDYYVASFSGDHTVEEIVQSFKGFAPGYKAS